MDGVDERKFLNMSSFYLIFNQSLHPLACYAAKLCSLTSVWIGYLLIKVFGLNG